MKTTLSIDDSTNSVHKRVLFNKIIENYGNRKNSVSASLLCSLGLVGRAFICQAPPPGPTHNESGNKKYTIHQLPTFALKAKMKHSQFN